MPSQTPKQHRAMMAAAHGKSTLGIPKKVGQDFVAADAGKPAALAKGGKLVEHDDHFKLHTAGGDVMTMAKKGLSPHTVKHFQKFAEKGEVEPDYQGGGGPGNEAVYPETQTPEAGAAANEEAARGEGAFGAAQPAASKEAEDAQYAEDRSREAMGVDMPGQEIKVGDPTGISGSPVDATAPQGPKLGAEDAAAAAASAAAQNPQLQKYASAKVHAVTPEEKAQVAAAEAARNANVAAQDKVAGDTEAMNNARQKEERDLAAVSDQKMHEISDRADKLRTDIENGKVDPQHYWHEKGAGGRVMASLGLILSGLGSGLGGGPNMAMQVIQKNIDRDIDAQEKNLKTKESLLADTYRQTGDLRLARQMAEHTLANVYLAQANTLAAKSSNAKVKEAAGVLNAQGQLALAQKARQIADQQSVNDVAAINAGRRDQNVLALQKAKTAGEAALKTPREMQGAKIATLEASKEDVKKHLEDIKKGFNGPLGSLVAKIPGASWTATGANTIASEGMAHALSEKLATALGGGAATSERIKELTPLIPLPSDTQAVRDQKERRLNQLIDTQLEAYRQQQGGVNFKVAPPTQFPVEAPTRKK